MIELLSPVGDLECLKAAVQSGANAVYFGAKSFGARAFASNFDDISLKQAIEYAKLRNVKTHLTLNTLIKNNEFEDAINIAVKAYRYGIDAIIIQDLGLAKKVHELFPDLDIHASTQMTIHNLEGVNELEKLGFKRAVLSRELSLNEIEYICKNTDMEIEVFIHGALCISYSGQCLFSSMIGGRSGNRGKCAQTCRLPFELIGENKTLDKGYLLSTRDLCSLEYVPNLIKAGVTSFKIEGRMKTPEYVSEVTKIYKKYINLALSDQPYKIDTTDLTDLMQVFNRGGFSSGHLKNEENKNLIYTKKQNNIGLYLGDVINYNKNKGHISLKLNYPISIGDTICFENEETKYTISELMDKNNNIKETFTGQEVTIGRMKGNIKPLDKIYKLSSKKMITNAQNLYNKENIKNELICKLTIKNNKKIILEIECPKFNKKISYQTDFIPEPSKTSSISKDKIIEQFNKTTNTPFIFSKIEIDLDENLFLPISVINTLRRTGLSLIEKEILKNFERKSNEIKYENFESTQKTAKVVPTLLLNKLDLNTNYKNLPKIERLYIPLKFFFNEKFYNIINDLSENQNIYMYLPTILIQNYLNQTKKIIEKSINQFNIKGFVISNLSELEILHSLNINSSKYKLIGNYTLNIYNDFTIKELKDLNLSTITISPELDKESIESLCNSIILPKELIVYGNIPVMTMNYCLLGKSNKCYKECTHKCNKKNSNYYLKDRLGILFKIIPDNSQTITTIYNSKTTSINYSNFNIDYARIDILDESIEEINTIINNVSNNIRFEGKNYTNVNLNREI